MSWAGNKGGKFRGGRVIVIGKGGEAGEETACGVEKGIAAPWRRDFLGS